MHVVQVSNLTAMIARDEYILEESYSGEEEAEEAEEETEGESQILLLSYCIALIMYFYQ